jgi:hypothetical protein
MALYTSDNLERFPFSGRKLAADAVCGLLKLFEPLHQYQTRAPLSLSADKPPPWNFAWTKVNGAAAGIRTNDLLFRVRTITITSST